jgi:hypothetical protein
MVNTKTSVVNCYQTLYAQRIAQMYQLNSSSGYINTFLYQTHNIDLYANLDYIIKQCKCQTTGNTKISKKLLDRTQLLT